MLGKRNKSNVKIVLWLMKGLYTKLKNKPLLQTISMLKSKIYEHLIMNTLHYKLNIFAPTKLFSCLNENIFESFFSYLPSFNIKPPMLPKRKFKFLCLSVTFPSSVVLSGYFCFLHQ